MEMKVENGNISGQFDNIQKITMTYEGETDNIELWDDPSANVIDAENYSSYDSETGVGRIVSDDVYQIFLGGIPVENGEYYKITFSDVVNTVGTAEVYGVDGDTVAVADGSSTVVTSSTVMSVVNSVDNCDVSFKMSLQKIRVDADPMTIGKSIVAVETTDECTVSIASSDGIELLGDSGVALDGRVQPSVAVPTVGEIGVTVTDGPETDTFSVILYVR